MEKGKTRLTHVGTSAQHTHHFCLKVNLISVPTAVRRFFCNSKLYGNRAYTGKYLSTP